MGLRGAADTSAQKRAVCAATPTKISLTGATQKKTYKLTDIFDISENGKYRFTTDCFVYDKGRGGESTECELWVEFTVTRVGDTSGDVKKTFVDFVPQYIRTNGYHKDVEYPVVKIIRSVDGLKAYYMKLS